MISQSAFMVVALILFILGTISFFVKKDLLCQFMSIEVMLNAGNLALLSLVSAAGKLEAAVIVLFVILVAAAEAVIGLSLILLAHKKRKTIESDEFSQLKG